MLWQAAYAEYIFQDTLWPDYDRRELWAACEEYASPRSRSVRERLMPSLRGAGWPRCSATSFRSSEEPDGALTVRHDGTFASLRVVTIVEDLDLVSLTQIVAWDLPLTKKISDQVAAHARDANFGAVTLVEKIAEWPATQSVSRRRDAALQLSRRRPDRRRAAHPDIAGARQRARMRDTLT